MFASLRKPRWQHSNPDKRRQAIALLDPANAEHSTILATLVRGDADVQVRITACRRLTDLRLLDSVLQQDSDPAVKQAAEAQICALLAGTAENALTLENRLRVVRLTDNQPVLAQVASTGVDSDIRLAAIERLHDASVLAELALSGQDAALRIAATERLLALSADHAVLRELAQQGRDKKVRQLAREHLKQQQQQIQQQEQRRQRAQLLIDEIDSHSRRQLDNLYAPRLQQLHHDWQAVADSASAEQQAEADQLLASCQARLVEQQRAEQQAIAEADAAQQQQLAISMLSDTLADLGDAEDWPSANNLQALLASQQQRWQAAAETCAATEQADHAFSELVSRWQLLIEHWRLLDSEQAEEHTAEGLAAEGHAWPTSLPLPPTLRQQADSDRQTAANPASDKTDKPQTAPEMERILAALAGALNQRKLKLANRLWHKAGFLLKQASQTQRQRLEKLQPRLEELRDWHAFAAEPKKLALCEQMEALIEDSMPAADKASAIQLLQDQWQELMSADQQADQGLWERFKNASDQAFLPCREHFAELDQQRAENLQKRQALCQQLGNFLDTLDADHSDWQLVATVRRQAPQEWKSYQPVRFADMRELGQQFSALLARLDALLDQVIEQHRSTYQQLIDQAEALLAALSDSEQTTDKVDANQAVEQCKALQRRWQQAGWLPQGMQHKLYRRFRQAVDGVFAARQQQQQAQQQAASAEAAEVERAIHLLREALAEPLSEQQVQSVRVLADALQALPLADTQRSLLQARQDLLREARHSQQRWPALRQWQQREQRILSAAEAAIDERQQTLAVAMEVSAGIDSPESAREARMQWQLAQLGQAMKQSHTDRVSSCQALLDDYPLESGLAEDIRQRLLLVWRQLMPR